MIQERTATEFVERFGFEPTANELAAFNGRDLTQPIARYYQDWHARRTTATPRTETLRSGHVVQTVRCTTCAGNVRLKVR